MIRTPESGRSWRLATGVHRTAEGAALVGVAGLLFMMVLTVLDVLLRYLFSRPLLGAAEVCELLMVPVGILPLGACCLAGGHVAVDFVVNRLASSVQRRIGVVNYLLSAAVAALLTWRVAVEAVNTARWKVASALLGVPHMPFCIIAAVGYAVLVLTIAVALKHPALVREGGQVGESES